MRRFAPAILSAAALLLSFGQAQAFFGLLFDTDIRTQASAPAAQDLVLRTSPVPREVVAFAGYAPGTIVVSTAQRRLYYVLGDGRAIRYGIGVGRPGFEWAAPRW